MPSSKAHVVRWRFALRGDARISSFTEWLLHKARESCEGCEWPRAAQAQPAVAPMAIGTR